MWVILNLYVEVEVKSIVESLIMVENRGSIKFFKVDLFDCSR